MADETLALVVDTGSYNIKVGYSGAEAPLSTFRSIVGYREGAELVLGDAALKETDSKAILHPIQHGIVRNWALAERLWMHAFHNELKVSQREHPVLLSEPPLNPKLHRERCCQLFFEAFDVPGLYMAPTSLLALYGSSKTTGLVLDVGEGVAHAVPINEGTIVPHAIGRLDVGGYDVTSFFLASIDALDRHKLQDRHIANQIKEQCGYVALDYENELKMAEKQPEQYSKRFTLPDGSVIATGTASFRCPEMLFSPEVAGSSAPKLADVVYYSVRSCEPEMHKTMFSNILLTGGSSLFPGFVERCEKDIKAATNDNAPVKIASSIKNRAYAVWVGGSIVASLQTFQQIVLVLLEDARDEQREHQRGLGVHLHGVGVGLDLAPGDGLVGVGAGVGSVELLGGGDVHREVRAVAHQIGVCDVVLGKTATQNDDAGLPGAHRHVVDEADVADDVDAQSSGLAAAVEHGDLVLVAPVAERRFVVDLLAEVVDEHGRSPVDALLLLLAVHLVQPGLNPVLERAVVVVRDEKVADTVQPALTHGGAVHVEPSDIGFAHALDQVLLHTAATGHHDVDELVLRQVDEGLAQTTGDHVGRESQPYRAFGVLADLRVLVLGAHVLLRHGVVAESELQHAIDHLGGLAEVRGLEAEVLVHAQQVLNLYVSVIIEAIDERSAVLRQLGGLQHGLRHHVGDDAGRGFTFKRHFAQTITRYCLTLQHTRRRQRR
ncbi:actin II [Babesia ovata]|uniref:Actin II n=1 Tax=Babesia ovata TaxID=189622 RepID=A0A2H6KDI7_9APIC|nr:actin II [Babesia ovata]GBE61055.1 actin II [Babesia ovata]